MDTGSVTISQAEYDALTKLKDAALIACGHGAWTRAKQRQWHELTGEEECLWEHLGYLAKQVPNDDVR